MSNNLAYGGVLYPNSSFHIDAVYPSYKAAQIAATEGDGVLIGRYVLVAYCDTAFGQDDRNILETAAFVNKDDASYEYDGTDEEKQYVLNFIADKYISYDRHILRKVYKNEVLQYEDIASLNSTLSDKSITVRGVTANDTILSLTELTDNGGGILSTSLDLKHDENRQITLKGKGDTQVGNTTLNTYDIVKENISTDAYLKWDDTEQKVYIDLSNLVNDDNQILSMVNEKIGTTLTIDYFTETESGVRKIGLRGKDDYLISSFDATDFIKDSFLQSVSYDKVSQTLSFVFTTENGAQQVENVSFDMINAGNGINIDTPMVEGTEDNPQYEPPTISINIDNNSDGYSIDGEAQINYLTVGPNGLKLSGINNAIDEAEQRATGTSTVKSGDTVLSYNSNNKELSTTLNLKHANKQISLTGIDNNQVGNTILDTYEIVSENVNTENDPYLSWVDGKLKLDLTSIDNALNTLEDEELIAFNPSAKITWTNTGSFEVGTKITPNYSISFTDGKYKYPLPNGTAIESSIDEYSVNLNNETRTTASAEFREITITENINLTGTATVNFRASDVTPVSNLGRKKPDSKYNGQDVTLNSITITGYREGCFYGAQPSKIEEWDSQKIRELSKMNSNYITNKKLILNIPEGTQTIVIACPADKTGPKYVLNTTVNAPMTELFGINKFKETVFVEGANNYDAIEYNLWIYQPAEPYSSPATLEITLG